MCNSRLNKIKESEKLLLRQQGILTAGEAERISDELTSQAEKLSTRLSYRYKADYIREALSSALKEQVEDHPQLLKDLGRLETTVVVGVYRKLSDELGSPSPLTGSTHAADSRTLERFARKS